MGINIQSTEYLPICNASLKKRVIFQPLLFSQYFSFCNIEPSVKCYLIIFLLKGISHSELFLTRIEKYLLICHVSSALIISAVKQRQEAPIRIFFFFLKLKQLEKVFKYLRVNTDLLSTLHTGEAGTQNI